MITMCTAFAVVLLRLLFPCGPSTGQHAEHGENAVDVWELRARLRADADHGDRRQVRVDRAVRAVEPVCTG